MSQFIKNLTNNFQSFFNLFLESNCPLCERPTPQILCLSCTKQLYQSQISNPSQFWHKPVRVFGWGKYGGTLKRAIFATKYDHQPQLAKPLGNLLGEAWLTNPPSLERQITVIPIPMHPEKLKQRGYNQAELIAKTFCSTTGLKLNSTALARVKTTIAQHKLTTDQREKNLHNAFLLKKDLNQLLGSSILLLDDIYTSGATAKSAILALRKHKINVLGIVTVAIAGKSVLKL
ncbi:MAG: ComF family protein [Mastigocoleus sp.]